MSQYIYFYYMWTLVIRKPTKEVSMKTVIIISLLILGGMGQAQASGCLGGDWALIEDVSLPAVEILTNYYGEPEVKINVSSSSNSAHLEYSRVGTKDKRLTFRTGQFSLKKLDLVAFLGKLQSQRPYFKAQVRRKVEENLHYDDCYDIPEGTVSTLISYEFKVNMPDYGDIELGAYESSYFPVLKD